jgi:hypothetical protein
MGQDAFGSRVYRARGNEPFQNNCICSLLSNVYFFLIAKDIIERWGRGDKVQVLSKVEEITNEKPKTTRNKQLEPNQVHIKSKNKHLKDI